MANEEYVAELEAQQEKYCHLIKLRDKLISRLLAEIEPICEECALKDVCIGAKYEACASGLLAAMELNKGEAE